MLHEIVKSKIVGICSVAECKEDDKGGGDVGGGQGKVRGVHRIPTEQPQVQVCLPQLRLQTQVVCQ